MEEANEQSSIAPTTTTMSNEKEQNSGLDIDRRTVLKGAAVGAGIAGMSGLATAGGPPCFKDFECPEGSTYVKFNFVIETDSDGNDDCYFEEETDTDLITIDSFTSKDGERCEPIEVEWSVAAGYGALKVMAYGGKDCVTATDPDPSQSLSPGWWVPAARQPPSATFSSAWRNWRRWNCPRIRTSVTRTGTE
ncbi:hypothetical protein [Halolamina rubra]|uniref:hypothetical protein n=1 Tax=Halolamina rubra TaxID=1380430 RepID=UPI0012AB3AC5|nr:hypothetical protein [Halolamina rubra]